MEIIIGDNKKLGEIQAQFNKQFPNLRLNFFNIKPNQKADFSKKNVLTDSNIKVGALRDFFKPATISFNGNQKVSTLESNFREIHGLYVQVFRKSGQQWLETAATDNWTLAKQNKIAEVNGTLNAGGFFVPDFDAYQEQP